MKKIGVGISVAIALIVVSAIVIYFAFPAQILKIVRDSEKKAASLTEKSIQVDDHLFSYYEGGAGDTVVLIHGFAAEKHHWAAMSKALVSKYHLIIPDLPGHGKTTQLQTARYDLPSQVGRLNRFLEQLQLSKVHIVGNSMGGQISGMFAATYPEKVLSLALFDSAGVKSPEMSDTRKILLDTGKNALVINNTEDFDKALEYGFYTVPFIPGPVKKLLAEQRIKNRAFETKIWNDFTDPPVSLEPLLPQIEVPTLILWGEEDRIIDVSSVTVFERLLKNHKTVILKECGHVPMLEKPEESAEHYLKFITRISSANPVSLITGCLASEGKRLLR